MSALLRLSKVASLARTAPLVARPAVLRTFSTSNPGDRKYTKSHEWAKLDGDVATVGISHHAQDHMGDIVFADLPEVGSETTSGEPAAMVESVKAAVDVYSPVGGEVVGINSELEDTPEMINEAPYEEGWLFKVKVNNPSEIEAMLDSDAYTKVVEAEE